MDGEDTAAASAKLTEAGDGVEGRRRADHASTSLVRRAKVDVIAKGDLWSADVDGRLFGYGAERTVRSQARWAQWPWERPERP